MTAARRSCPARFTRRKQAFLAELERCGMVQAACCAAGISRATAYRHRARDPAFGQGWDDALEVAADKLEIEAHRRAVAGTTKPAISGGKVVLDADGKPVEITTFSDRLLETLLKGARPDKYRDHRIEHSGNAAQPIVVQMLPGDGNL